MNDKQQLAAMGEHMSERAGQEQPMCMAKRIEELEGQVRVMAESLCEAVSVISSINHGGEYEVPVEDDDPAFWQRGEWVEWAKSEVLPKLQSALACKLPEPAVSDATVALSDIASLQRYTLGGHCDDFGQDCGAEMEQDDEGEYILLSEALMLAASTSPDTTK